MSFLVVYRDDFYAKLVCIVKGHCVKLFRRIILAEIIMLLCTSICHYFEHFSRIFGTSIIALREIQARVFCLINTRSFFIFSQENVLTMSV